MRTLEGLARYLTLLTSEWDYYPQNTGHDQSDGRYGYDAAQPHSHHDQLMMDQYIMESNTAYAALQDNRGVAQSREEHRQRTSKKIKEEEAKLKKDGKHHKDGKYKKDGKHEGKHAKEGKHKKEKQYR